MRTAPVIPIPPKYPGHHCRIEGGRYCFIASVIHTRSGVVALSESFSTLDGIDAGYARAKRLIRAYEPVCPVCDSSYAPGGKCQCGACR